MGRRTEENRNPRQELPEEFFQTGHVIELEENRYFAGFRKGRIRVLPVEQAKYFPDAEKAERYARRYMGFAGMRVQICRVCWTLAVTDTMEHDTELVKDGNGREIKFATYQEAVRYQKKYAVSGESVANIHVFCEKEIILAA